MFSGLVQCIGKLKRAELRGDSALLHIAAELGEFQVGESIAVNGACLSVTTTENGGFEAFASTETLSRTGLGDLIAGASVNLERALRLGDRLGGHLVSGHVDTRVKLLARDTVDGAERWSIALPEDVELRRQLAPKGSVTLDGISLTVNDVGDQSFEVMIIPITLESTTLSGISRGTLINLETDVLAKYVAAQLERGSTDGGGINLEFLVRSGFAR